MQTDKERLAEWLGQWLCQRPEDLSRLAQNLLDKGVTLPPAPVDPAWMEGAAKVLAPIMGDDLVDAKVALWDLLRAGYRIIPPTQDRAAVIEKALEVVTRAQKSEGWWKRVVEALYNAGMLVEGDGR